MLACFRVYHKSEDARPLSSHLSSQLARIIQSDRMLKPIFLEIVNGPCAHDDLQPETRG